MVRISFFCCGIWLSRQKKRFLISAYDITHRLPCIENALVHQQWVRHNHLEYNIVTKTPSVNTSRCRLRSSLTCTRVYLKRNFFLPWIIKIIPGPKVFWNNLLPCEKAKQVASHVCLPKSQTGRNISPINPNTIHIGHFRSVCVSS